MSGYQVQTQSKFGVSSLTSPFSQTDELQNEQIYNLQQFQEVAYGDGLFKGATDGFGTYDLGGTITLPESATNPLTPYVLTIDQLCNRYCKLITPSNANAYSIGGGPTTGTFQTGSMKTYYVNIIPFGIDFDNGNVPVDAEMAVEFFQKLKGTYGFNQIPSGWQYVAPSFNIGRGTAIALGVLNRFGGVVEMYYTADYLVVNQADFAGAPLRYNMQAATAVEASNRLVYGRTWYAPGYIGEAYTPYLDTWFSTLFPEAYNTPASRCPKVQVFPLGASWPTPL